MKNERLKESLDDALSGIGENPWLLRQVMARAESCWNNINVSGELDDVKVIP